MPLTFMTSPTMEETKGELSYAPDSQVNIGFRDQIPMYHLPSTSGSQPVEIWVNYYICIINCYSIPENPGKRLENSPCKRPV